jgi:hypothetical protein
MTVSGGFVMPRWALAEGPTFVLYGNGVVIYRPSPGDEGTVSPGEPREPYRCLLLSPEQVDELLGDALEDAGLAEARELYPQPDVADVPNTVFEIDAGGTRKTVVVQALGIEDGAPDAQARQGFLALAELLADFQARVGAEGVASAVYAPGAYRGILTDAGAAEAGEARAWPWSDLDVADFVGPEDGVARFAVLTPEQVAAVTDVPSGGVVDILVVDAAGTAHDLSIRPLLPGEEELPAA